MQIDHLRRDYTRDGLHEKDLAPDPIAQFRCWFQQALEASLPEPNAMTLATVSRDGTPSARIVLLKAIGEDGLTFFTSYQGRKARELGENARAALVFYWAELERQVRFEGMVEKTSDRVSDEYFRSRPRGSQLGAWASSQSEVVADRAVLEKAWAELEERFAGKDVERPPFWGGYLLRPNRVEFWQGRTSRLHDRLVYRLGKPGKWSVERLAP